MYDKFTEDNVTNNILSRLNTTLSLVDKEVECNTHNKRLFIKLKSSKENEN